MTELEVLTARLRAAGCVFAEDEAALLADEAATAEEFETLVGRRIDGEPLEHVVGWAQFVGQRVHVASGVFVPRRRSELLAREAFALADAGSIVLDLCCGSGALGAVIAATEPLVEVFATDIDDNAVACARRNLGAEHVFAGDLFEPLPASLRGKIDVIAANAPYVPTDELRFMPPEARNHEPVHALDGGGDGLDVARRIIAAAPDWLAPGGALLIETGRTQATTLSALMASAGLTPRTVHDDELDSTVVIGSTD